MRGLPRQSPDLCVVLSTPVLPSTMSRFNVQGAILEQATGQIDKKGLKAASGAAGGAMAAAAVGPGSAVGNALVSANGVMASKAMAVGVETIGARNTGMLLSKFGGASSAAFVLPVGIFGVQFASGVTQWWKGEIDGQTLTEQSTINFTTMAAGFGGGAAGAAGGAMAGAWFGPVGAMIGTVVGALGGGMGGACLGETATRACFDAYFGETLEKRTKLRMAYADLGLEFGASNERVHKKYQELTRKHQNDKGEKIIKTNAAYEIIRASQN